MFAAVSFGENFVDWAWMALGVLVAVIWPWLMMRIKQILNLPSAAGINWAPVLIIGTAAAIGGLILLAIYRSSKPDEHIVWFTAFLTGYGFEAILEKWRNNF